MPPADFETIASLYSIVYVMNNKCYLVTMHLNSSVYIIHSNLRPVSNMQT